MNYINYNNISREEYKKLNDIDKKKYLENSFIINNNYINEFFDNVYIDIDINAYPNKLNLNNDNLIEIKFNIINKYNNNIIIKNIENCIIFNNNFKNPKIGLINSNEFLNSIYHHFINYYYKYLIYFLKDNVDGLNILNLIYNGGINSIYVNNNLNIKLYEINYSFSPNNIVVSILVELLSIYDLINEILKLDYKEFNFDNLIKYDILNDNNFINIDLLNKFKYLLVNIGIKYNINFDFYYNKNINDLYKFNNSLNINNIEYTNIFIREYLKDKFNNLIYKNDLLNKEPLNDKIKSIFNYYLKLLLTAEELTGHSFYYFYYINILIKMSKEEPTLKKVINYNEIINKLKISYRNLLLNSTNNTIIFPIIFFDKILIHKIDIKKLIDENKTDYNIFNQKDFNNTYLNFLVFFDNAVDFIDLYFLQNNSNFIKEITIQYVEEFYYNTNDLNNYEKLNNIINQSNFNEEIFTNSFNLNYFSDLNFNSISLNISKNFNNFFNNINNSNNNLLIKLNNEFIYMDIIVYDERNNIDYNNTFNYFWTNCSIIPSGKKFKIRFFLNEKVINIKNNIYINNDYYVDNDLFYFNYIDNDLLNINYTNNHLIDNDYIVNNLLINKNKSYDMMLENEDFNSIKNDLKLRFINNNKNINNQYINLLINNKLFLKNFNYFDEFIQHNENQYKCKLLKYIWLSNNNINDIIEIETINEYKMIIEEKIYYNDNTTNNINYIIYNTLKNDNVFLNKYIISNGYSMYYHHNKNFMNLNKNYFRKIFFKIHFYHIGENYEYFNINNCFKIKYNNKNNYINNNLNKDFINQLTFRNEIINLELGKSLNNILFPINIKYPLIDAPVKCSPVYYSSNDLLIKFKNSLNYNNYIRVAYKKESIFINDDFYHYYFINNDFEYFNQTPSNIVILKKLSRLLYDGILLVHMINCTFELIVGGQNNVYIDTYYSTTHGSFWTSPDGIKFWVFNITNNIKKGNYFYLKIISTKPIQLVDTEVIIEYHNITVYQAKTITNINNINDLIKTDFCFNNNEIDKINEFYWRNELYIPKNNYFKLFFDSYYIGKRIKKRNYPLTNWDSYIKYITGNWEVGVNVNYYSLKKIDPTIGEFNVSFQFLDPTQGYLINFVKIYERKPTGYSSYNFIPANENNEYFNIEDYGTNGKKFYINLNKFNDDFFMSVSTAINSSVANQLYNTSKSFIELGFYKPSIEIDRIHPSSYEYINDNIEINEITNIPNIEYDTYYEKIFLNKFYLNSYHFELFNNNIYRTKFILENKERKIFLKSENNLYKINVEYYNLNAGNKLITYNFSNNNSQQQIEINEFTYFKIYIESNLLNNLNDVDKFLNLYFTVY